MGTHYKKMSTENGLLRRSMENTAILPNRRYYKSQEGMKASFMNQTQSSSLVWKTLKVIPQLI